jgi:hypothetical protein
VTGFWGRMRLRLWFWRVWILHRSGVWPNEGLAVHDAARAIWRKEREGKGGE